MSSLVNMRFVCEQTSLPVCSVLFKDQAECRYPARSISLGTLNIYSPYTVIFLTMSLWMINSLINRTKRLYSFPARKEMLLFLRVYFGAIFLELFLCFGIAGSGSAISILQTIAVSLQMACAVTSFVAAFGTGIVWIFPIRMSFFSASVAHLLVFVSFSSTFMLFLLSIMIGLGEIVFALMYPVPLLFSAFFGCTQLVKLKRLDAEIWTYGSIAVAGLLIALAACTPFGLSMGIVLLSNRYLDGLFLMHFLVFLAVLKVYNLWTIDKEQEIECVNALKRCVK